MIIFLCDLLTESNSGSGRRSGGGLLIMAPGASIQHPRIHANGVCTTKVKKITKIHTKHRIDLAPPPTHCDHPSVRTFFFGNTTLT